MLCVNGASGATRVVTVGRVKVERRQLVMVEAEAVVAEKKKGDDDDGGRRRDVGKSRLARVHGAKRGDGAFRRRTRERRR